MAVLSLQYKVNPVGWLTCRWLRHLWPGCLTTFLNGLTLRRVEAPALAADDWVRLRTRLAGICGSDVALALQKQPASSFLQAFSSQPMALGHENLAVVEEIGPAVDREWMGRRVCVEPTLGCVARGIEPLCPRCREGEFGACHNFAADGRGKAKLPPGVGIGYNSRTGGAFSEAFVAHQSQLVRVPHELSDDQALLTDPVACGLHAVLRADVGDAANVLIYGAGVIGLCVVASLRAMGYSGRIEALGRREYLGAAAQRMGADEYFRLPSGRRERFEMIAQRTGGTVQVARFNNRMLSGGYDAVFDCVGSVMSMNESLKWTRARGKVVLVGTGSGDGVDVTPMWFRELTVVGAYGRQVERLGDRRVETYQLVHELMTAGTIDVRGLVTHTFRLSEWRKAFDVAMHKAPRRAVKVAIDFR